MTFGFSYEWEEVNSQIPVGFTGGLSLTHYSNSSAQSTKDKSGNYTNVLDSGSGLSLTRAIFSAQLAVSSLR